MMKNFYRFIIDVLGLCVIYLATVSQIAWAGYLIKFLLWISVPLCLLMIFILIIPETKVKLLENNNLLRPPWLYRTSDVCHLAGSLLFIVNGWLGYAFLYTFLIVMDWILRVIIREAIEGKPKREE